MKKIFFLVFTLVANPLFAEQKQKYIEYYKAEKKKQGLSMRNFIQTI